MQSKELLKNHVKFFTEEQAANLLFVIELALGNKDKGDIMKLVDLYENVDSAKPQPWSDKMRNEMQANPMWYVWSYKELNIWGKPEHLLEALLNKLSKTLKENEKEKN